MRSSTLQEWTAGGSNSLLTETTNFDTNIFMERVSDDWETDFNNYDPN